MVMSVRQGERCFGPLPSSRPILRPSPSSVSLVVPGSHPPPVTCGSVLRWRRVCWSSNRCFGGEKDSLSFTPSNTLSSLAARVEEQTPQHRNPMHSGGRLGKRERERVKAGCERERNAPLHTVPHTPSRPQSSKLGQFDSGWFAPSHTAVNSVLLDPRRWRSLFR